MEPLISPEGSAARERLWQTGEALRQGWREFLAFNPPQTLVAATLPRGVLQIVFFTLLGHTVSGGLGREQAFLGALVLTLSGTNVTAIANVPLADKFFGTFWRIRTGRLPTAMVVVSRAWPYPVVGFVLLVAEALAAAALMGMWGLALHLLPWLWLLALMSLTFALVAIAWATLTIGRRADVLAPNLLAFAVVLFSGAVIPPGRLGWVDAIGTVMPTRHGLAALRAALDGRPWASQAWEEILLGAAYAIGVILAVRFHEGRAQRLGLDDFA
jgi:ABC-type multidrug transport system permease subunit